MVEDPERVAYVTQTTLSVDETSAIVKRLHERFPSIAGPRTDDICYATTNRQAAVKQMAGDCDLMLVIGSRNSSNSVRLVEVARDCGTEAYLIDHAGEVREEWLDGQARRRRQLRRERPRRSRARPARLLPRARGAATSPSSTSSARTCASCCPSRSARPSAAETVPRRSVPRAMLDGRDRARMIARRTSALACVAPEHGLAPDSKCVNAHASHLRPPSRRRHRRRRAAPPGPRARADRGA